MNLNTPEYWDKQWQIRGERVYPYYKKIAGLCGNKTVLDFGCGRGDLLQFLPNGHGMDLSKTAIEILKLRGLKGEVGDKPTGKWDIIVATEVLEHLDDDEGMLKEFFEHTDTVIYAVPNNCLGPDVEPEHQRLYTTEYVKKITPHLKRIWVIGKYLVVLATKEKLKPSVLCAVLNQGNMRVELANMLIHMAMDSRCDLKIYYPTIKPIAYNRNQIVKKFLEGTWDYLLMVDSDNPPLSNPLDLVGLDKDVIGLPTPQYNETELYWVAMKKVKGGYQGQKVKQKGLQQVDAVGTGCVIIARRVLEKVKAPFMRKWDKDGIPELGLDLFFCEKAIKEGFKVWVHWDYLCSHFKEIDLLKLMK